MGSGSGFAGSTTVVGAGSATTGFVAGRGFGTNGCFCFCSAGVVPTAYSGLA